MKTPLLLVGGGGHCASCIEAIESGGLYSICGIVDTKDKLGSFLLGYGVVGTDDDLAVLYNDIKYAHVSIGQLKSADIRINIYQRLKELQFLLPAIIASSAIVARTSLVEEGCVVMHFAMINSNAKIANNCIVNTGAVVEHDTRIGAHTHVSTGALVNGGCTIGSGCLIGSGSVIKQGIYICDNAIIGAGSVVIKDILEPGTYAGNPARKIYV